MTRLNRPDSLLTELRDIKRRLHALETAQRNTGTTGTVAATRDLSGAPDESDAAESTTPDGTTDGTGGAPSPDSD